MDLEVSLEELYTGNFVEVRYKEISHPLKLVLHAVSLVYNDCYILGCTI